LRGSTCRKVPPNPPLDDDRIPTLVGKYKVPHFDAKGLPKRGAARTL